MIDLGWMDGIEFLESWVYRSWLHVFHCLPFLFQTRDNKRSNKTSNLTRTTQKVNQTKQTTPKSPKTNINQRQETRQPNKNTLRKQTPRKIPSKHQLPTKQKNTLRKTNTKQNKKTQTTHLNSPPTPSNTSPPEPRSVQKPPEVGSRPSEEAPGRRRPCWRAGGDRRQLPDVKHTEASSGAPMTRSNPQRRNFF